MVERLELFGLGFSWGGYESLAITVDPQLKARTHKLNYPGPVLRLHIGLERVDDLIAAFRHALDTLSQDTTASQSKLSAPVYARQKGANRKQKSTNWGKFLIL